MADLKCLQPLNRHLVVIPHFEEQENDSSKVLLPEDFERTQKRYIQATIVSISSDCSSEFKKLKYDFTGDRIIVLDSTMLEKVSVKDKDYYMILENYVMGIFRRPDEN